MPRVFRLLSGCVLVLLSGWLAAEPQRPPSVVFILADDLRQDALGVYGNTVVETPHLDQLAARGATFTRATCSYPICTVSRSEILSGRIMIGPDVERGPNGGLRFNPSWMLWPGQMKRFGWRTVHTGKWHVGGSPASNGFMETAGLFSRGGGPPGVKATLLQTPTGRAVTGYTGWTFKDAGNRPQPELGVSLTPRTDAIMTGRAVEAIRRLGDEPLFLHVNFTAPHDPLHWPAEGRRLDHQHMPLPGNFLAEPEFDTGNISGRDEKIVPAPRTPEEVRKERAIYFSMVENLDRQAGRTVRALEETGQLHHTISIQSIQKNCATARPIPGSVRGSGACKPLWPNGSERPATPRSRRTMQLEAER
ncbi:MAG: sulfatase-like hydrolase/transferase [Opitutaceae bacterium]